MKRIFIAAFLIIFAANAHAVVKLRDIAHVDGIMDNAIYGYGLVVGLNGTGDKDQTKFTTQSLVSMLEVMGVTVDKNQVKVKNVAAVMVQAKLPAFARTGQPMDVTISSVGDAKSLEGGTLLPTRLVGPNGEVFAVAQGPLSVGGMNVSAGGASVTKNHPTVGRIPNGGMVTQELKYAMDTRFFDLYFSNPIGDVISAKQAINAFIGTEIAVVTSPSNIKVTIPGDFQGSYYDFLNAVLNLEVQPETFAKVIMDERTGTIVMGSDVRISTVAVAHGNLTITITNNVEVSQPLPFTDGQTVVTNEPEITVAEDKSKLMVVPEGVTVSDLVKALNAIGVSPRDLMAILQSIKAAGALHGQLEVI